MGIRRLTLQRLSAACRSICGADLCIVHTEVTTGQATFLSILQTSIGDIQCVCYTAAPGNLPLSLFFPPPSRERERERVTQRTGVGKDGGEAKAEMSKSSLSHELTRSSSADAGQSRLKIILSYRIPGGKLGISVDAIPTVLHY